MRSQDASPRKLPKKKLLFFSLSMVFFIVFFCLITVEILSVVLIKRMGYSWEPAYLRIIKGYKYSNLVGGKTEDHSWGQWNVPNYEGRVSNNCIDTKYKFNSYGARDKERSVKGKDRTLVFGDSFIEGWGVDQDKTLPSYLEKVSGKEFLNFGNAGGFSVLNDYILYKDFANKFEHDAVLVGLTIGNDFSDNDPASWLGLAKIYYRPFWKLNESKTDFEIIYLAPYKKGKLVPGLEPDKYKSPKIYNKWQDFSAFLQLSSFVTDHKVYFDKDSALAKKSNYNLDFSDDEITATILIYDRFSQLIGNKNKYVVILPSAPDVYYHLSKKNQKFAKFEEFKKSLENQGWKVIDAMTVFNNQPIEKISSYFICDGHWSAKGNELLAPYLYNKLK